MLTNILIGFGIGLVLGAIIGGAVGLICGYDWGAGQLGRAVLAKKPADPSPLIDEEAAPTDIWLPHVKGINEP